MNGNFNGILDCLSVDHATADKPITHTRIQGGKYHVPQEKLEHFYKKILKHGIQQGETIDIVERMGPIHPFVVDIDIKYNQELTERQYTQDTIYHICSFIWSRLHEYLDLTSGDFGEIYVMEKDKPYPCTSNKQYTYKDGIHIVFPRIIIKKETYKTLITTFKQENAITDIFQKTCADANLVAPANTEDTLLDGCFSAWQPYGCSKPNESPYLLTSVYTGDESSITLLDYDIFTQTYDDNLFISKSLSVISHDKESITYKPSLEPLLKGLKPNNPQLSNMAMEDVYGDDNIYYADNNNILHKFTIVEEERLKYVKGLATCLSVKRAEAYDTWLAVGHCLHNINSALLPDWKQFSSFSSGYDPTSCDQQWSHNENSSYQGPKFGIGSLIEWAKSDNFDKFKQVKSTSVESHVDKSVKKGPDADYLIAVVIQKYFDDEYISVDVKNDWYSFNGVRWERTMEGEKLRKAIHNDIYNLYYEYQAVYKAKRDFALEQCDDEDEKKDIQDGKTKEGRWLKNIQKIQDKLLKESYVNTLMSSLKSLFYKKDIMEEFDTNLDLLGFENGIYDLKGHLFREGRPEDYITMSTKVSLPVTKSDLPLSLDKLLPKIQSSKGFERLNHDFQDFLQKIMPDTDLHAYTKRYLSKCLSGENKDEVFGIWIGDGSNGKSKMVDIMKLSLGEYACNLPIALLTQKRKSSGAADPEMARTRGVRFVYMQEPDVNETLNVGEMKEITGNDTIQARALYKEPFEFIPQFKLILMCNSLPSIPSDDNGTWRRLEALPFKSTFVDDECDVDPTSHKYIKDKSLKRKLAFWKIPMFCMLFQEWKEYDTHGIKVPHQVKDRTDEYRNENDVVGQWITDLCESADNIIATDGVLELAPTERDPLYDSFEEWCEEQGQKKVMDKKEFTKSLLTWQTRSSYGLKIGKNKADQKPNGTKRSPRFNLKIIG